MKISDIFSTAVRASVSFGAGRQFRRKAGVCSSPFYPFAVLPFYFFTLLPLLFVSCSGDDDGGRRAAKVERQAVRLYLNVPRPETRVGDPGQPTGEGIDWDKIAVMIEYPNENGQNADIPDADVHSVIYVTKAEYDAGIDSQGYYWIPLELPEGTVRFYGVTYSAAEGTELEEGINNIDKSADKSLSFANLEISNDYATTDGTIDVAKYLSVATGYYEEGGSRDFTVEAKTDWKDEDMPRMTLKRLAAKFDIQWDAADAYPTYTDVGVDNFVFYNNRDAQDHTDKNQGSLFPSLHNVNGANGHTTFYNTSAVSRRNGRVYHYMFPNGAKAEIRFDIKWTNGEKTDTKQYIFNFNEPTEQATWYKVNTTIKGDNGETEYEVTPDGTASTATD